MRNFYFTNSWESFSYPWDGSVLYKTSLSFMHLYFNSVLSICMDIRWAIINSIVGTVQIPSLHFEYTWRAILHDGGLM